MSKYDEDELDTRTEREGYRARKKAYMKTYHRIRAMAIAAGVVIVMLVVFGFFGRPLKNGVDSILAWAKLTKSESAGNGTSGNSVTGTVSESTDETEAEDETTWCLVLVNKWNELPSDYQVQLMALSNGEQIDKRIYPALQQMFDDMRAAGVYPEVRSGYRSSETQQMLFDEKTAEYTEKGYSKTDAAALAEEWVAAPGYSEHQLGIAVDINADGINSTGSEVYEWLDANGWKYGFIKRYPDDKKDVTGVGNEPWHYRYAGIDAAAAIHDQGICLEEYLKSAE